MKYFMDALEKAAHELDVFGHAAPEGPRGHRLPVRLDHGSQTRDRRRHAAGARFQSDEPLNGLERCAS